MAFSTAEKTRLVRVLGWEAKVIDSTSTVYNSVINDRLDNHSTSTEEEIRLLIERMLKLDERLDSAVCRVSTKEIDGVVLNPEEIPMLRRERMRVIREISFFLGIPSKANVGVCGSVRI